MTGSNEAGSSAEQPLYFRWVQDETGIRWDRIIIMLGLTVLTAYLSVRTQRAASAPDLDRTLRMKVAQKTITAGVKLQRAGIRLEEAGWSAYEAVRQ